MSNTAEEKTNLVLKVLRYAKEHDLDVSKKDQVQKILAIIDSERSVVDMEQFMGLLRDTDTLMEMISKKHEIKKTKSSN